MPFERFMELALYHPTLGYYAARQPPGATGDFFTASQLQPVFGILIRRLIGDLRAQCGMPARWNVVELGPGRGEMEEFFREFGYVPVGPGDPFPERIEGVVFSNEFFDALPVRLVEGDGRRWRERVVVQEAGRFVFQAGGAAPAEWTGHLADARVQEIHLQGIEWMRRIAAALSRGYVVTIDYGYTARERAHFPDGTLMSYRRHTAVDDVLIHPGEQDITSHVPFDALERAGTEYGLETIQFTTLAQLTLRLGERDGFAEVLGSAAANLQLKSLLFGMGETFRVLVQRKRK